MVFAPYGEDNVGVFNTADDSFITITTTGVSGNYKYRGAAAVGSKVYFGPDNEDNVGRGLHLSNFQLNLSRL